MSDAPSITESTAAPAAAAPAPAPRGHETVKIRHGSVVASPEKRDAPDKRDDNEVSTVRSSTPPQGRSFTEHQRAMLRNLDEHGDVRGKDGVSAPKPEEPTFAGVGAVAAATPEAKAAPAVADPKPAADTELTARANRLAEANKRLVAEIEKHKTSGAAEPDERTKALHEIERDLTTDFMGSLRKLVALNAGIKDAASPDVDRIMAGNYALWTEHELKMPLDAGKRAEIGTERNRLLIERDRRDREAQTRAAEAKTAAEAQTRADAEYVSRLDTELGELNHAEKYPLLMKHARLFDSTTPAQLLLNSVRAGIKAGEVDPKTPGSDLLHHYSKVIETHYQALRDEIAGASATSTATPAQPTVSSTENTAGATTPGARTITNASASVAPPALPAKPTPTDTDQAKPKYRNETARRHALAERYFGKD
jgi:hypothetical protein